MWGRFFVVLLHRQTPERVNELKITPTDGQACHNFFNAKNRKIMAQLEQVVIASSLKSNDAKVARVMNYLNLNKAIGFVLRDPSTHRRSTLYHELNEEGRQVGKLPVGVRRHPKAHRIMVICSYDGSQPIYQNIRFFREKLQRIFGPKCRYCVRAYERIIIKVEESHGK